MVRIGIAVAAAVLLTAGAATAETCPAPLKPATEIDLYFGRDIAATGEVSDVEWTKFLAEQVTPRFPDGLSVVDVAGQYRESGGRLVRERTKMVVIVVFDELAHLAKVQAIVDAHDKLYGQRGVFRVEHAVCGGG